MTYSQEVLSPPVVKINSLGKSCDSGCEFSVDEMFTWCTFKPGTTVQHVTWMISLDHCIVLKCLLHPCIQLQIGWCHLLYVAMDWTKHAELVFNAILFDLHSNLIHTYQDAQKMIFSLSLLSRSSIFDSLCKPRATWRWLLHVTIAWM